VKDPTVLAALHIGSTQRAAESLPICPAALAVPLDNVTKVAPPTGGLMGSASFLNINDGTLYPYDAIRTRRFQSQSRCGHRPTAEAPTLADVNPKISRIFDAPATGNPTGISRRARIRWTRIGGVDASSCSQLVRS
jgi:hypothetical protein